jgi:hypothetical protein
MHRCIDILRRVEWIPATAGRGFAFAEADLLEADLLENAKRYEAEARKSGFEVPDDEHTLEQIARPVYAPGSAGDSLAWLPLLAWVARCRASGRLVTARGSFTVSS